MRDSPTASDEPTSDRDAIQSAYERYWSLSWDLDQYPHDQWHDVLSQVATDPALTTVLANTDLHVRNGITLYGAVVPHVTNVDIDGDMATVTDCQDASDAGQADVNTGERKTVGVERSPVTATLTRGDDGTWRVSESDYTGGDC